MPPSDPWLIRQNAALKLKGHGVSLDVAGCRVRLRATMPPRPTDVPSAEPKQHRISTGLVYPAQATESLQLAELGPVPPLEPPTEAEAPPEAGGADFTAMTKAEIIEHCSNNYGVLLDASLTKGALINGAQALTTAAPLPDELMDDLMN